MKTRSILLLCTIFLLTPLMFIPSIHAVNREITVSGIAEQDAITSSGTPDIPIGSMQDNLEAGYNIVGNYLESYLYFNFTNKPTNYSKVELSLHFWGKDFPGPELNLTICLIEESWDEQTITWNNAPSKGQVLGYYIYNNDAPGVYKLDISSVVDGIANLSVCVYMEMDNFVENSAPFYSSEDYLMQEQAPQIIWTYIEDATFTVIKPDSLSEWSDSDTFSITWLSQGQIEHVRIELFEGSTPITNISSYQPNDGIYNWTIPSYLNLSGTNYLIKISDYYDPAVYGFSEPFSINIETINLQILIPGYPMFLLFGFIIFSGLSISFTLKRKRKIEILS